MPAETVGDEIRHLQRDKGYPHRRAVAAALSMQRRGQVRRKAKRRKRTRY